MHQKYEYNSITKKDVSAGYTVVNSVTVTLKDTKKAGQIIDIAIKNGATNVSNLSFTLQNTDSVCKELTAKAVAKAKNEEGERILKVLKNDYLIGLDLNKKEFTSEEFANFIQDKFVAGGSSISFVIGGSYGLSDSLKKRCNSSISLSKMTFLHQMTRLVLLEQIYRAFKILNNETYHK